MLNNKQKLIGTMELTLEENKLLRTIFSKRLRMFLTVLGVMTLWMFYANFSILIDNEDVMELTKAELIFVRLGFLFFLIYGGFAVLFFKRIFPLYRDYKHNRKQVIRYTITMKRYFEYNNQYYIGIDHPDYLFHQVEKDEWLRIEVGHYYALFRAPYSKYMFNAQGRYSII